MREILFRGKRKDNGEWKEGFLVSPCHIGDWVLCEPINPKTVGQFTGLTDKNGKKIFEGDVVSYCWYEDEPMNFQVEFCSGEFLIVPVKKRAYVWAIRISGQVKKLEVIGNIHDNPELMEV